MCRRQLLHLLYLPRYQQLPASISIIIITFLRLRALKPRSHQRPTHKQVAHQILRDHSINLR